MKEADKFVPDLSIADLAKSMTAKPDVFVTQKSVLQREGKTGRFIASLRFKYLIVDECQTWVRGQPGDISNQLRFLRLNLLPRAEAVFLLSGTPFPGKIQFDLIQTIKSLASPARRARWSVKLKDDDNHIASFLYTDNELLKLDQEWNAIPSQIKPQMLVPILLRRTSKTTIDEEKVLPDYLDMLVGEDDGEIPLTDIKDEVAKREVILNRVSVAGATSTDRYTLARWLAWTSWVINHDWNKRGRNDISWWDNFTLDNAREFERGRRLVGMLEKMKRTQRKPIIFAHAVFHQQLAAHVLLSLSTTNATDLKTSRF